jgi:hypothetical protein
VDCQITQAVAELAVAADALFVLALTQAGRVRPLSGLARTRLLTPSHHAQAESAHDQTRCRRHNQRCDADSGKPIPTEREASAGDHQPGDREDTAISDPSS